MKLYLQVSAVDDPLASAFRYEFDADRTQILLGRRGGVDVLLPHPRVSLVHARIERHGTDYFLADEGSTNGTRLNGLAIPTGQRRQLKDGDRIAIGDFLVLLSLQPTLRSAQGPMQPTNTAQRSDWQPEASSSLARRMAFEVLERLGPGDAQPSLQVLDGPQSGVVLVLAEPNRTFVLGRAGKGDLRLDDVDMWRERTALERNADGVTARELSASAQLAVNGERVSGARLLHDGDVLLFGGTSLRYADPAEVYLRKLEAAPDEAGRTPAPSARDHAPGESRIRPDVVLAVFGVAVAVLAAVAIGALLWR